MARIDLVDLAHSYGGNAAAPESYALKPVTMTWRQGGAYALLGPRQNRYARLLHRGLLLIFVPLFAWWFEVDLWTSFLMDLGLLLFFMVYTYAYGWLFDRLFGLPASAC